MTFLVTNILLLSLDTYGGKSRGPRGPRDGGDNRRVGGRCMALLCSASSSFGPCRTVASRGHRLSGLLFRPLISLSGRFGTMRILTGGVIARNAIYAIALGGIAFSSNAPLATNSIICSCGVTGGSDDVCTSGLCSIGDTSTATASAIMFGLLGTSPCFRGLLVFPVLGSKDSGVLSTSDMGRIPVNANECVFGSGGARLIEGLRCRKRGKDVDGVELVGTPSKRSVSRCIRVNTASLCFGSVSSNRVVHVDNRGRSVGLGGLICVNVGRSINSLGRSLLERTFSDNVGHRTVYDSTCCGGTLSTANFFSPM